MASALNEKLERILAPRHAGRRRLLVTNGWIYGTRLAQPERRHVYVDVLVGPRRGDVSLVPYADGAVLANGLVKCTPRGQVLGPLVAGVGKQLLHAAPVLDHDGRTPEPSLSVDEAE